MHSIDAFISVVVPVYNAQGTLRELAARLDSALSVFGRHEIILVDDCSADQSFAVIESLAAKYRSITGIRLDRNYGQQSAVFCGLRACRGDYAVVIDDDLEQNPEDIPKLYDELQKGYDCVYGINEDRGSAGVRSFGSTLRDVTFNLLSKKDRALKVCSFRILNRSTIDKVVKADTKFVYISMEILRHTRNIANVEVAYNPRKESGYSFRKLARLLANIYIYYLPCRLPGLVRKKGNCYRIMTIAGGKE